MIRLTTLALAAALLLANASCSVTSTPAKSQSAHSTYDKGLMTSTEAEIKDRLQQITIDHGGVITQSYVDCTPDNDRTFTCQSSTSIRIGSECGTLKSEQRGTVDLASGRSEWKSRTTSDPTSEIC